MAVVGQLMEQGAADVGRLLAGGQRPRPALAASRHRGRPRSGTVVKVKHGWGWMSPRFSSRRTAASGYDPSTSSIQLAIGRTGKASPSRKTSRSSGSDCSSDDGRQGVQLLGVGALEVGGEVEAVPERTVVDAVQRGEHPVRDVDVAVQVGQLRLDPLGRPPVDGDDVQHRIRAAGVVPGASAPATVVATSRMDSDRRPSLSGEPVELVEQAVEQGVALLGMPGEVLRVPPEVEDPAPTGRVAQARDEAAVLQGHQPAPAGRVGTEEGARRHVAQPVGTSDGVPGRRRRGETPA